MKIVRYAKAGTDEKSDAVIEVFPWENDTEIEVHSPVETLFGRQIRDSVREVIEGLDAGGVKVVVNDHSALDFVLRARTETALLRAGKEGSDHDR